MRSQKCISSQRPSGTRSKRISRASDDILLTGNNLPPPGISMSGKPPAHRKRNSPPATAWGVKKICSYRELVMEDAAKKWFATMPAKERLKEIRAAIADGLSEPVK